MRKSTTAAARIAAPLVASAALLLAAGCSSSSNASGASGATDMGTMSAPASAPASAAAAQVPAGAIKVELSEFKFTPATIDAKAGTVVFDLVNTGTVPHDLAITTPSGTKTSPQIQAGGQATWQVDLPAGTYTAVCDLPGHAAAGMKATVVVK